MIYDLMYGWLKLTPYLKSMDRETYAQMILKLQENKSKRLRLLCGEKEKNSCGREW